MPVARLARFAAALALTAAAAAPAAAQVTVTYNGSTTNATAFGYYVGPESGTVKYTLPNSPTVQTLGVNLFCVDFLDHITDGQTYAANVSGLAGSGAIGATRHPASLTQYREAAFLTDQFAAFGGAPDRNTKYGAIQGAIWSIFGTGSTTLGDPSGATGTNTIAYWAKQAADFAGSAQYGTYDYSRFYVLTDTRVSGTGAARYGDSYAQEFIGTIPRATTTPEPASIALMAAGLLGLGAAAARRRREVSA